MHIALNVRHLRIENGLSLSELARASGVSKGTLSRLEAGSRNPTIKALIALANSGRLRGSGGGSLRRRAGLEGICGHFIPSFSATVALIC